MKSISDKGLSLLKEWEGLSLEAYKDGGDVMTIGYGHTSKAGPPSVYPGMKITLEQAEDILRKDVGKYAAEVNELVSVPLTQNQFDALVSFHYNTGSLGKSTLLKKLNAGDYDSVPDQMMRWVYDNKKKERGLVNRRTKEAALFVEAEPVNTSSTAIRPASPPVISKENAAFAVPLVAGALGSAGDAFAGNGPVQWALCAVILVGLSIGLYFFFKRRAA